MPGETSVTSELTDDDCALEWKPVDDRLVHVGVKCGVVLHEVAAVCLDRNAVVAVEPTFKAIGRLPEPSNARPRPAWQNQSLWLSPPGGTD